MAVNKFIVAKSKTQNHQAMQVLPEDDINSSISKNKKNPERDRKSRRRYGPATLITALNKNKVSHEVRQTGVMVRTSVGNIEAKTNSWIVIIPISKTENTVKVYTDQEYKVLYEQPKGTKK